MRQNLNRVTLAKNAWRFRVSDYAHKVSRGAWIKYRWVVYVLSQIQLLLMKPKPRIIVNAPPQHGKSESISRWLPTWFLDWWPERNVVVGSYEHNFATQWGIKVRETFLNNPLTWTEVDKVRARSDDWWTTKGGGMRCAGIDSGLTGRGYDLGIIDDPYKGIREALSPTYQQHVIDWFKAVFYTRKSSNGAIIVNHTRWNTNDLTQYLIDEHKDNWDVIKLPAIAHKDDPLGRNEGEPLCEERYTKEDLEDVKSIGSLLWSCLYDQDPKSYEGNIIKRKWFKRYRVIPESFDRVIIDADLTFSKEGSSYVCLEAWGQIGPDYYLVDLVRDKLDVVETAQELVAFAGRWPQARAKIIEKKANGDAILRILSPYLSGLIPYEPTGKGSKEVRLVGVQGLIEGGNVWVPETSWGDEFIDEVVAFPKHPTTDMLDCMTMALDYMDGGKQNFDLIIPSAGVRQSPWDFANTG